MLIKEEGHGDLVPLHVKAVYYVEETAAGLGFGTKFSVTSLLLPRMLLFLFFNTFSMGCVFLE